MGKLSKKIGRKKEVESQKEMASKVALFGKIGEECLVCQKPFDKTSKEMVKSWYVIVRNESKEVNLYCPPCWQRGSEMVKDIQEKVNEREKK
jgi:hypothetical protein